MNKKMNTHVENKPWTISTKQPHIGTTTIDMVIYKKNFNTIRNLTCKSTGVPSPYEYRDAHAHKLTKLPCLPSFNHQVMMTSIESKA